MKKNLVLISSGSTFMVNAIENNLKEAGFQVSRKEPVIKVLSEISKEDEILLM